METGTSVRIDGEREYQLAIQALSDRARPPWMLRALMNALETYRQARKLGWSRPQNKAGLNVFHAYETEEAVRRDDLVWCVRGLLAEVPEAAEHEGFLQQLLAEPKLMGFLFVHDLHSKGRHLEGMTFSFGRRVQGAPRYRDRFDLIVESEVLDGTSRGFSRLRAYVDPFRRPVRRHPAHVFEVERPVGVSATEVFERAVRHHRHLKASPAHHWSHWTSDYIDYFGPRVRPVAGTYFAGQADDLRTIARAS